MTFSLALVASTTALLAAEVTGDPWDSLLKTGGPLALIVVLFVADKITTTSERDRLRSENAELRTELRTQNESIRREVVPPLVAITNILPQLMERLASRRSP